MPEPLKLTDMHLVAENDYGWRFLVARLEGRWVGLAAPERSPAERAFAEEGLPVDPQMLMILAQVSEGFELGVPDRDTAIKMTGAVAQDVESSYGGVDRWHVPEELRAGPDDFRCNECGSIGCNGECRDGGYDPFDENFPP